MNKSKESYEDMVKRFNDNPEVFITSEIFRIFYQTKDEKIKLDALKALAAQQ